MNMELLQNSDVLMRVLLLLLPTVAAFLASVVYLFSAKRTEERSGADSGELGSAVMLFLPICMTNLIYFIMTVILLFINEQITADKITEISIPVYVLISVLNAVSCVTKGIIGGVKLRDCTGADKQNGLSKSMLYMAAAEIPGLIAFAFLMIKFLVSNQ